MLMRWKRSNDIFKYCAASNCEKVDTQKNLKNLILLRIQHSKAKQCDMLSIYDNIVRIQ